MHRKQRQRFHWYENINPENLAMMLILWTDRVVYVVEELGG